MADLDRIRRKVEMLQSIVSGAASSIADVQSELGRLLDRLAGPASIPVAEALRDQIAAAVADAERNAGRPVGDKSPWARQRADIALDALGPLLAAKDAEIEGMIRALHSILDIEDPDRYLPSWNALIARVGELVDGGVKPNGKIESAVTALRAIHYADRDGDCPGCGLTAHEDAQRAADCPVIAVLDSLRGQPAPAITAQAPTASIAGRWSDDSALQVPNPTEET
ncbi:MAG TPA: hypothetical protein VM677_23165 [Actinokineospora sp.]|nr:hypothetical protein [Actinokineospora sp.]